MRIFKWLWEAITNFIGLLVPMFGKARGSKAVSTGFRWTIHALLILAVLIGLHFLNGWLHLERKLFNVQNRYLKENWLPILFLLVYVLCWIGRVLWRLLVAEPEYPEFADIQEAWDDALKVLEKAGIDLTEVPLFLVLGRPEGPMDSVFQSSRMKWTVKGAPGNDAPVQVYATAEQVYVTCVGASVLGKHATLYAGGEEYGGDAGGGAEDDAGGRTLGGATLQFNKNVGGAVAEVKAIVERAMREGRRPSAEEQRIMRAMMRKDRTQQPPIRNAEETGRLTARFEHLCRLIVRDRFPFCPINGILLLIPFTATDSDQDAVDTGATSRVDLATARRVLQVNAPTLAMLCDLETAPGFGEFVERFPEAQRKQRIGQRCPLVPSLPADEHATKARTDMLMSLADWLCGTVTSGWVYKNFELEQPGRSDQEGATRGNARLFQFMDDLRSRQKRLGRLLIHSFLNKEETVLPRFGGCYLGATGKDSAHEQAFVPGVFRRLADEENNVTWTDVALEEESSYSRWIGMCQTALGVLVLAELALLAVAIFKGDK